jgi:hypothetical protein
MVFFLSRNRSTLTADPLISFFNMPFRLAIGGSMLVIVTIVLAGSLFYTRFWCRYLCPAGAFLSLLNNITILKRYLPAKRFAKCEFGLTANDHNDCIYCDRCRYRRQKTEDRRQKIVTQYEIKPLGLLSRYFVVVVITVMVFVSTVSISKLQQVFPAAISQPAVSPIKLGVGSAGQPRDVDLQKVRTLMEQKGLSDREAEFYKKVE